MAKLVPQVAYYEGYLGVLMGYLHEYDRVFLETDGAGNEIARNVKGTNS